MRYVIALAVVLPLALAGILPAEARRVALVVGNADYKVGPLANPVNDAAAVAEAFEKQLKFDKVLLRRNLGLDGFRAALREMARESLGAEFGVIYFAGHGVEVGGRNYLIPTDAALAAARDIELEALALDIVLGQLDGVRKLKLVILDACRNNPFAVAGAKRSVTRGLGRVEPEGSTLVAYAAKDGTTADDGTGRHSPFTVALLKRIATPGLDVRRVFGYVSDDVLAATNRVQEPYLYGRLGGEEVYLIPAAAAPTTPSPPAGPSRAEVAQFCQSVAANPSLAVVQSLLAANRGTPMEPCIEARIEELRKLALAAPPAPPPALAPAPAPAAVGVFNSKRAAAPLTAAEERALRPKDSFKECNECPEMVVVPAGSFMMGSSESEAGRNSNEGPQRRVTIARPFAVSKFEVTLAGWDACIAAKGCSNRLSDEGWGRGQRPAISVTWNEITKEYLPWISQKTGKTYRLLTEAEWEYAARSGTTTPYAFGSTISKSQAHYSADRTLPVGSFAPNAFGLHDMHGNVAEWVHDCSTESYNGAPSNGSAWTSGDCASRRLRGGSWNYPALDLRSALRDGNGPDARNNANGFRVARSLTLP